MAVFVEMMVLVLEPVMVVVAEETDVAGAAPVVLAAVAAAKWSAPPGTVQQLPLGEVGRTEEASVERPSACSRARPGERGSKGSVGAGKMVGPAASMTPVDMVRRGGPTTRTPPRARLGLPPPRVAAGAG